MEGCGLRRDLEAPVEKGRALLLFQRGPNDWVSQGRGRQDVGRGLASEGSLPRGVGARLAGRVPSTCRAQCWPGLGTVGTEGLRLGAPTGSGARLAGWTWPEGRWLGSRVPAVTCSLSDSGHCQQTSRGVG